MTAVKEGDLSGLTVLFERYHIRLFNFFCRMNGSRTSCEDLVQEVFVSILKYKQTFRQENSFVPWMYQIARNVRLKHFRKQRRHEGELPAPDQGTEQTRASEELWRAIGQLPEDKRELLILVWYQDMKHKEIAETLGITVGAVKVRVHRVVKELREILQRDSGEKQSCVVKSFKTTPRTI
jgi:RNA polymerase sigma factor (sigma-70 family)